eukprot:scaffold8063_cov277-Pinguiococcus_pyrenoidosus.AAC.4
MSIDSDGANTVLENWRKRHRSRSNSQSKLRLCDGSEFCTCRMAPSGDAFPPAGVTKTEPKSCCWKLKSRLGLTLRPEKPTT